MESNRLVSRTLLLGFIVFAIIIFYITRMHGVLFLAAISLTIGFIVSLIWKKLDPVTGDDLNDNHREVSSFSDDYLGKK